MQRKLQIYAIIALWALCVGIALSEAPLPPENLTIQSGLFGGAVLKWDTSAGTAGYCVYKSADGVTYRRIASVRQCGFVDWWIFPDLYYRYYVTAFTMAGVTMEESGPGMIVPFALGLHHMPLPGEGILGGKIVDDRTGQPLRGAMIRFYRPGRLWTERTHTDSGGIYWAALDTGRYIIRADKFDYFGEWFDNVLHVDSASVVTVHEDTVAVANFALHHIPTPVPVTVTGRVTDSLSGVPVPGTFVAYLRPHRWLKELQIVTGLFGGFADERCDLPELGRMFGVVWIGRTDADGYYTARILKGVKYIALAFKPEYIGEFYNDKYTPFDADRLRISSDTSGIDFRLLPNPATAHSLSGSVTDSAGTGIPSNVLLYRRTAYGRLPVRFAMTDSLGNFEFHSLVAGVFYLKTFPVDAYAPAWYSNSGCGVRNWHFADTLRVSGDVGDITVCVKPAPRFGFARVAGNVGRGSGNLFSVLPEQGVTVYAVSVATGEVMGYDLTEDDGAFAVENLPEGSYSVVADKEGFNATTSPVVTLEAGNNYEVTDAAITLSADPTSVEGNRPSLPAVYRLYQNYPNPFNPVTNIRFDLPKTSQVTVKVYNLIGQKVVTLLDETMAGGEYSVKWDARDAGSGIYFVKIVALPDGSDGGPFAQVRKMILMK